MNLYRSFLLTACFYTGMQREFMPVNENILPPCTGFIKFFAACLMNFIVFHDSSSHGGLHQGQRRRGNACQAVIAHAPCDTALPFQSPQWAFSAARRKAVLTAA